MPTVRTYVARFERIVAQASAGHVEEASVWYEDAERVASDVARIMGISLECGASIVSAFSPRERWTSNVRKAIAFAHGEDVQGLANNLHMAQAAEEYGFDALKGLKTNAFARAIAGDHDAVVIDVWMMRAAGLPTDAPNKGQYRDLSEAVRKVARKHGMTPRAMQALIWILVRGTGE